MLAVTRHGLFGAVSALLAVVAAAPVLEAQRAPADTPNITAAGCLAQSPDAAAAPPTGHEEAAARGLTLERASVKSTDGRATRAPVEQSFWLVGAKSAELTRFVGKRVEIAGTIDERLTANPGTADAGAAAARRAATAPPDAPSTAHPSAPKRAISVLSFRVLDGSCP